MAMQGDSESSRIFGRTAGRSTTQESREIKKGYRAGENCANTAEKSRKQANINKNNKCKLENNQVLRAEIKLKIGEFKLFL